MTKWIWGSSLNKDLDGLCTRYGFVLLYSISTALFLLYVYIFIYTYISWFIQPIVHLTSSIVRL